MPYKTVISADGKYFALLFDYTFQVWSVSKGELIAERKLKAKGVYAAAFSPDGKYLAIGTSDKKIRVWEMKAIKKG